MGEASALTTAPSACCQWAFTDLCILFFFFQASAIGVFGAVPDPILGGGMSRIVGDSEQGNEFIIRSTDLS